MTSKNTEPKSEMVLMMNPVATRDTSGDSTFYTLSFVKVTYKPELANSDQNFEVTNISDSDWRNPGIASFHDFCFRAWISWPTYKFRGQTFSAEQWEMLFKDCYSVGLKEAERMLKLLKKAQKIQDAFTVRPTTFGEFVVAMSKAFKVKHFIQLEGRDRGSFYSDNRYSMHPIEGANAVITAHIFDIQKRFAAPTIPTPTEEAQVSNEETVEV
jgi:hypothetical protein